MAIYDSFHCIRTPYHIPLTPVARRCSFWSSVVFRNVSQVDRIWSIIPIVYAWVWALHPFIITHFWPHITPTVVDEEPRLYIMAILVTLWGCRLTFNAFRRGYYSWGHEDYRWDIIRRALPWPIWQFFNFSFIAFFQNLVLFLIVTPGYVAHNARGSVGLNWIDYLATALIVICLIGETTADQQQWNYQTKKYSLKTRTGEYAVGFLRTGLFRFSRHPNYFFELSTWWAFYLFSVAVSGQWLNWTLSGPILLTVIFAASTPFTEKYTREKYPLYEEYCQVTPMLIPFLPSSWSKGNEVGVAGTEKAKKKE
jgi:steroid 5-alpha reductase family enzyme